MEGQNELVPWNRGPKQTHVFTSQGLDCVPGSISLGHGETLPLLLNVTVQYYIIQWDIRHKQVHIVSTTVINPRKPGVWQNFKNHP